MPFPSMETVTYKTTAQGPLALHIFRSHRSSGNPQAAIVFFFGGSWRVGSPVQFFPQCQYLAARGMVAITADYRVHSRHGVSPAECVADARSAMRYVRAHAAALGIDPARLVAGGGSAGGHLALCCGLDLGPDDPQDDVAISPVPTALVLFNPVVDAEALAARMGQETTTARPVNPISGNLALLPPTILFHGQDDTTVPYASVERFQALAQRAGAACEVVGYPGEKHGFFNYQFAATAMSPAFVDTLQRTDASLVARGFLVAREAVEVGGE